MQKKTLVYAVKLAAAAAAAAVAFGLGALSGAAAAAENYSVASAVKGLKAAPASVLLVGNSFMTRAYADRPEMTKELADATIEVANENHRRW